MGVAQEVAAADVERLQELKRKLQHEAREARDLDEQRMHLAERQLLLDQQQAELAEREAELEQQERVLQARALQLNQQLAEQQRQGDQLRQREVQFQQQRNLEQTHAMLQGRLDTLRHVAGMMKQDHRSCTEPADGHGPGAMRAQGQQELLELYLQRITGEIDQTSREQSDVRRQLVHRQAKARYDQWRGRGSTPDPQLELAACRGQLHLLRELEQRLQQELKDGWKRRAEMQTRDDPGGYTAARVHGVHQAADIALKHLQGLSGSLQIVAAQLERQLTGGGGNVLHMLGPQPADAGPDDRFQILTIGADRAAAALELHRRTERAVEAWDRLHVLADGEKFVGAIGYIDPAEAGQDDLRRAGAELGRRHRERVEAEFIRNLFAVDHVASAMGVPREVMQPPEAERQPQAAADCTSPDCCCGSCNSPATDPQSSRPSVCPDCNGTREYRGLNAVEPCRTCCGAESAD